MGSIASIDLSAYRSREQNIWHDDRGLVVSVHEFDLPPDLPAALQHPAELRHQLAQFVAAAGGGLIEAAVTQVDAVPAVRQLIKVPRPHGPGQVFLGSYTIPKTACSVVIKVQAAEGATTGIRETVVLDKLGPERYFQQHPYGSDVRGGLPFHAADAADWDEKFPDHPLTLVRTALEQIVSSVRLEDQFRALPGFNGPARPPTRRWFGRAR
jgi:hypothetical protein